MTQSPEQREGKFARAAKGEKGRLRDKTVTFTLSVPRAIFGAAFSLVVLVWVFIFGIMIGRGHNPEEIVPELAKVMPSPGAPDASPSPLEEMLLSKDLKYHDTLKGRSGAPSPAKTSAQPEAPQKTVQPKPVELAARAEQKKPPASKAEQPKPARENPPAVKKDQTTNAGQDKTVYNYAYQVAAFNNLQQAQTVQKKLQNAGLSASVAETRTDGATWFKVVVAFKGKPEDTRALREKLTANGMPSVILRSKTPAK